MNATKQNDHRGSGMLRSLVVILAVLATLPFTAAAVDAQATATIVVNSYAGDGATPLPFARFTVTDSNGTSYGPLEAAPPGGQIFFSVDAGDENTTFTVEETQPPSCGVAPDPVELGPLAAGDEESVDFATSFNDDCGLGSIAAYKYNCPDGFDGGDDYAAYSGGCTEVIDGAPFQLLEGGSEILSVATGAYGITGRAPIVDLNPGDYVLRDAEGGNPVVFCLVYDGNPAEATSPSNVYLAVVNDGGTSLGIDGQRVACDFFNVPGTQQDDDDGDDDDGGDSGDDDGDDDSDDDDNSGSDDDDDNSGPGSDNSGSGNVDEGDDDDDQVQAQAETGSIELHKAACPPGYDAGNYFVDCHYNGIEGIEFAVDGPGGYSETGDTVFLDDPDEDPGPGVVVFDDLDAGVYEISEEIPGDVNEIYVYCSLADAEDQVPFEYNNQDGIDLDLGEGVDVICDWYNTPVQQFDPGTLTIVKYTCPAGYDGDALYADFLDDCDDPTEGVTFRITEEGAIEPRSDTTDAAGEVFFDNLNPRMYQIGEDVPDEFALPAVFCSVNGGNAFELDVSDGHGYLDYDGSGQEITCDWFNVPEDLAANSSLTFHKWLCPEGFTGSAYADNCDDALRDVTFNAAGPGGYNVDATTGAEGIAYFENLAAGDYTITETAFGGVNVAVYVVSCAADNDPVDFTYDDASGLRIKLRVAQDTQVTCDWYNIPPPKGPSGSITVKKFHCQGKEGNDYNWEADCDPYGAGAGFDLTKTGGQKVGEGETDASGVLRFPGLANGAYELDETTGNWCHAEADVVDAAGNVRVVNGGNTDVFIYNCGPKNIDTLPSTGAGPTGSGGISIGLWSLGGGLTGALFLLLVARRVRRTAGRGAFAVVRAGAMNARGRVESSR